MLVFFRLGTPGDVPMALQAQAVSYSDMASVTVITYDIITTLSDQINFLRSTDRTYLRLGYVLIRYLPCLAQIGFIPLDANGSDGLHWSGAACRVWGAAQVSVMQLVITLVDAIQMLRIYALFRRHTCLVAALCTMYAAEVLVVCSVLGVSFHHTAVNGRDCFVTHLPRTMMAYWLTPLVFQTALFVLTLCKFILACRDGWGRAPVMRLFIADGTWAFGILFFTMLLNFVLSYTQHGPYAAISFTWLLTVLSFTGTRLLNNPRRVLAEPHAASATATTKPEVELDTLFDVRSTSAC